MVSGLGLCCWLRFLPAIAPEDKTDRHRGANRLPVERKTDAETSGPSAHGKAKRREKPAFSESVATHHGSDPTQDDGGDKNERIEAHKNQEQNPDEFPE